MLVSDDSWHRIGELFQLEAAMISVPGLPDTLQARRADRICGRDFGFLARTTSKDQGERRKQVIAPNTRSQPPPGWRSSPGLAIQLLVNNARISSRANLQSIRHNRHGFVSKQMKPAPGWTEELTSFPANKTEPRASYSS